MLGLMTERLDSRRRNQLSIVFRLGLNLDKTATLLNYEQNYAMLFLDRSKS